MYELHQYTTLNTSTYLLALPVHGNIVNKTPTQRILMKMNVWEVWGNTHMELLVWLTSIGWNRLSAPAASECTAQKPRKQPIKRVWD